MSHLSLRFCHVRESQSKGMTQSTHIIGSWLLALLIASGVPLVTVAETTIRNDISVQASGGSNSVSVHSVINGEIVESYTQTSDEPISYEHTTVIDDRDETTTTATDTTDFAALIKELQALLALYVSLLHEKL